MIRPNYLANCLNFFSGVLESLHHVANQRFEMLLIDEARTIGGLVGGATMPSFDTVYALRQLC